MCVRSLPDIVSYRKNGRYFTWMSGHQHFDMDELKLAKMMDFTFTSLQSTSDQSGRFWGPNDERAALWIRSYQRLIDWWIEIGGGTFSPTVGGLGYQFFRSRLQPMTCLDHTDLRAKSLELAAIHGERASVWYAGAIGRAVAPDGAEDELGKRGTVAESHGPVTLYDVRSMHPYLLQSQEYPVKWLSTRKRPTRAYVLSALADFGVIARVRLVTQHPEYPHRSGGRIVYPTGQFLTTLAGPELRRALEEGSVAEIAECAVYRMGRPFTRFADDLLKARHKADDVGNDGWSLFAKMLSNSMPGKLAQRKGEWRQCPTEPPKVKWGEWPRIHAQTGHITRFRCVAGLVTQWVEEELGGRPMGAAFAYLTSYGRLMMRDIRERIGPRRVVAQDTDGLWVLRQGDLLDVLPELPLGDVPGTMREDRTARWGRWYGPKHYVTDGRWVVGGMRLAAFAGAGPAFRTTFTSAPIHGATACPPAATIERSETRVLTGADLGGIVGDDGWITPFEWLGTRPRVISGYQGRQQAETATV